MSSHVFKPRKGPILVQAEATGPLGTASLNLVLDTGATRSLVKRSALIYIGIDPDQSTQHIQMTTGSKVEVVPIVVLTRFSALGQHRFGFPIIGWTMIPACARPAIGSTHVGLSDFTPPSMR